MVARDFVFAHLADAHVGAWPRDGAVRRELRASVLRALEVVEERNAEFLLVSGDLFHTPVPEPSEAAPVAAALRRLASAGRRVYVIYGSHDYVAHRTSWLDVLAETGLFIRPAPEAVRAEGTRWTLPFLEDAPTGARIAGISGRAQGLDRAYFAGMDSERFRQAPGFKIFQFHAAVQEYLPAPLREHIQGISRSDLPPGCDYYAGGHIHTTYVGSGSEGGLLVNPGAVFGTSVTDLENGLAGRSAQGVCVVTVRDGRPNAEFVRTARRDAIRVVDVDVTGRSASDARQYLSDRLEVEAAPGVLLFPRVRGTLSDGTVSGLGLQDSATRLAGLGVEGVHWDVRDVEATSDGAEAASPIDVLEREAIRNLQSEADPGVDSLQGALGVERIHELLRELGLPRSDGEARADYVQARVEAALTILGVRPRATAVLGE
jgi:DNA repair exonuclease SbcCD nuclease subunit